MGHYLVRYGEIFLKSEPVRRNWERVLQEEIRARMPGVSVRSEPGRIWLDGPVDDAALARVFGVVSFSPVVPCALDELEETVRVYWSTRIARSGPATFAVRVKRVGSHAFSSQEKASSIGQLIGEMDTALRVDLEEPDVTLHVEIRDERCYLYHEVYPGPGGLPPGTQGTLVALVSGGIDSPVAAYLMMRRGCRIVPLYVALDGFLDETAMARAGAVVERLRPYQPDIALHVLPEDYLLHAKNVLRRAGQERYTCVVCKRRMYRLAGGHAAEIGACGIVTGEALGQVASQTLDNLRVLDEASVLPVYRPLIGLDKEEIIAIARRIGTFETSITPASGCRAVPSMPATRAKPEVVRELEASINGGCAGTPSPQAGGSPRGYGPDDARDCGKSCRGDGVFPSAPHRW